MAKTVVTPEELETTARNLQTAKGQVESQLAAIQSQVVSVASVWEGPAQKQFKELMDRWSKAGTDLNATLETIHKNMTTSAQNYRAAEDAAKTAFTA